MKLGIVSLALALLAAFGLYTLKDQVQLRERELRGLHIAISAERLALNRLRAEWAMLNQPGRIARLAAAHLELQPARPGQIVRVEAIPLRADLAIGNRQLIARLPSGVDVPLRLKPAARLMVPAVGREQTGSGAR